MKRTYTKPALYAETFELLEHISSCKTGTGNGAPTVTYRDGATCTYTDANITLFNEDNTACKNEYYEEGKGSLFDDFNGYLYSYALSVGGCYNAFSDGNFFAS